MENKPNTFGGGTAGPLFRRSTHPKVRVEIGLGSKGLGLGLVDLRNSGPQSREHGQSFSDIQVVSLQSIAHMTIHCRAYLPEVTPKD